MTLKIAPLGTLQEQKLWNTNHLYVRTRTHCRVLDKIQSCRSYWINNTFITTLGNLRYLMGISVNYRSLKILKLELRPHWQPLYQIRTWNSHLFWRTPIKWFKCSKNQLIISSGIKSFETCFYAKHFETLGFADHVPAKTEQPLEMFGLDPCDNLPVMSWPGAVLYL